MDRARAVQMSEDLLGHQVGGWNVGPLLGHGKSALVLKAEKNGVERALKVFDPELIEAQTREVQLERIGRELSLVGNAIDGVVSIYDGGECAVTKHLFVVMEIVEWPTLEDLYKDIPSEQIPRVIEGIANAARELETRGIFHRDIKPSNIAVCPESFATKLLDLGVIKRKIDTNITDVEGKAFIGTLRYASPEFLAREEDNSVEGWRAVTFYQIGAVGYAMAYRKEVFHGRTQPYSKLVIAVQSERPDFENCAADAQTEQLVKTCLLKNPAQRLQALSWSSFTAQRQESMDIAHLKQKIRQVAETEARANPRQASYEEMRDEWEMQRRTAALFRRVSDKARDAAISNDLIPPATFGVRTDQQSVVHTEEIHVAREENLGMSAGFVLILRVEVIDLDDELINVTGDIALNGSNGLVDGCTEQSAFVLFRGAFQEEAFAEAVEKHLLEGMFRAQSA